MLSNIKVQYPKIKHFHKKLAAHNSPMTRFLTVFARFPVATQICRRPRTWQNAFRWGGVIGIGASDRCVRAFISSIWLFKEASGRILWPVYLC